MLEVADEKGYLATRVSDVIARAGVSNKTFYEQFADKEECFLAAYDLATRELLAETAAAYERSGRPWPERVHHGVGALLRRLSEHPAEAKVCVVEVLAAGPEAIARRNAAVRSFTYLIDAGRGETDAELPGSTALGVIGGVYEILYMSILDGSTSDLPRLTPDLVHFITLPFLGADRAAEERERSRELIASGGPLGTERPSSFD